MEKNSKYFVQGFEIFRWALITSEIRIANVGYIFGIVKINKLQVQVFCLRQKTYYIIFSQRNKSSYSLQQYQYVWREENVALSGADSGRNPKLRSVFCHYWLSTNSKREERNSDSFSSIFIFH